MNGTRRPEGSLRLVRAGAPERVIAARLFRASALQERALGLLGRAPLRAGEGLWLEPCGSIHTWGMRTPIDALFLDQELRVLRVTRGLRPWRIGWAPRDTRSVVELPAGAAAGVSVGERVVVVSG
jgi:uncharacterized protein